LPTPTLPTFFPNCLAKLVQAIAAKFNRRFERFYERLADHPDCRPPRPKLGSYIRSGVVLPYVVIYQHVEGTDIVSIIRMLHGRRLLTRKLLQGEG
jgi:toxin ParE1/3/4